MFPSPVEGGDIYSVGFLRARQPMSDSLRLFKYLGPGCPREITGKHEIKIVIKHAHLWNQDKKKR